MIKALFKFNKALPSNAVVIDTTSSSGQFRELSPFILPAYPAKCFENLWQFSKVYPNVQPNSHVDSEGNPNGYYRAWCFLGWSNPRAQRYPMGKGAIPLYSWWNGEKLNYIEARKKIYTPEYAKNVIKTDAFKRLQHIYQDCYNTPLILLDYDAYDYEALGMTLIDVINNPKRKMGHAFVLLMMLEGELGRCIESPISLTAQ